MILGYKEEENRHETKIDMFSLVYTFKEKQLWNRGGLLFFLK